MPERTVAVTGIGVISPIGSGRAVFWDALVAGRNGAGPIARFDASGYPVRIACEVRDFDPDEHLDKRDSRKMDLCTQYGVAAALMAWKDSGLADGSFDPLRAGAIIGSGVGGIQTLEDQHATLLEKGPRRVSPYFIPMLIADMPAGMTSILLGLRGPNFATVSACASGAHAIGEALRAIQRGDADIMVAGGAEAAVCPLAAAGFASMKALSLRNDDPTHASRPFDAERDGFVLGEGAGIVVLEEAGHAKRRGARIYALAVGYGATADAYHMTAPDPAGAGSAAAMSAALADAGLAPSDVQYVNAHGTSTPLNDKCETEAIKAVFGAHAKGGLAVSSTKSMIGHLLGAAGGVEFAATALAITHSVLPPTINYEVPDPDCDLDYVPNQARDSSIECALTNSFGFGGHNAVLALRRFDG